MSDISYTVPLHKSEKEGVFVGAVLEPDLLDAHGDTFSPAEIEQAAHQFLRDYALAKAEHSADVQHSGRDADADLLESFVAPCDLTLAGQPVRAGSWIQAWLVNDPLVKQEIDEGKLTGLSLEGTGFRRPLIGGSDAQ
jgi:hypothetical protein